MTTEESAHSKDAHALYAALLTMKNTDEMRRFLRDVLTIQEIEEMTERWKVARLLDEGLSYRTIAEQTGMSTTTVGRIARWMHNGEGGYQLALDRTK